MTLMQTLSFGFTIIVGTGTEQLYPHALTNSSGISFKVTSSASDVKCLIPSS